MLSASSNEGQNSKWCLLKQPCLWPRWGDIRCCICENLDIRLGMWQLAGAFRWVCKIPPYNISTKRKWGGISFAGERETILNAISLDIWTAAGLIKGFQPLLGFLAQFLLFFFLSYGECSGGVTATWQRRDEAIGPLCCFTAFAAATFEFLAEREAVVRGTTNTTYRLVFVFAALCQRHCAGAFSSG